MRLLNQPRQSGKSHGIAQEMKKDRNAICIQPTERHVRAFCKSYNFTKARVMTFSELVQNPISPKKNIYFDEIIYCLQLYFSVHKLMYGTYTPEEYTSTGTSENKFIKKKSLWQTFKESVMLHEVMKRLKK